MKDTITQKRALVLVFLQQYQFKITIQNYISFNFLILLNSLGKFLQNTNSFLWILFENYFFLSDLICFASSKLKNS